MGVNTSIMDLSTKGRPKAIVDKLKVPELGMHVLVDQPATSPTAPADPLVTIGKPPVLRQPKRRTFNRSKRSFKTLYFDLSAAPVVRPIRHTRLTRAALLVAPVVASDLLALFTATLLAFASLRLLGPLPIRGIHSIMPALTIGLVLGYLSSGLYGVVGINPVVELRQLTRLNTLILLTILVATYIVGAQRYWRLFFLVEWAASVVLLPLLRAQIRPWCSRRAWWGQPALVFGTAAAADHLAGVLRQQPACGIRPVARVTARKPTRFPRSLCVLPTLANPAAQRLARHSAISYGIIVAGDDSAARSSAIAAAHALGLPHLLVMAPDGQSSTLWADARECAGLHAMEIRNRLLLPWPRFVKRASDLLLTLVGGILISPLLLLIALAVKLTSPGPVFFGHTRIGKDNRRFKAWKFRTMRQDAESVLADYLAAHPELKAEWEQDHKLKNDPRITKLGKFLRKTSLDEFPQLWNVIKGDMSLVGPRPIVEDEVEKYGDIFGQYLRVRPGITGMWQVSGRNDTVYPERIKLDDYYVRNWSPWLDVHILLLTLPSLFMRTGAY